MATDGQSVVPAPAPVAAGRRPHRLRNLLLIVIAFAVVLAGAAAGTLFYFYDKATGIDRSTPEVVTQQFLNATLIEKDPEKVGLFVCDSWSGALAIAVADPPSGDVTTTWGDPIVMATGGSATVTVGIQFSISAGGGAAVRDIQSWTLALQNQDGWRVCSLMKNGSLNP